VSDGHNEEPVEEKKQLPSQQVISQSPPKTPTAQTATSQPPKPPPTQPKPVVTPAPQPPQQQPRPVKRRFFLKFLVTVGALLALAPYVPFGEFLSSSVNARGAYAREQVFVDNNPALYGSAAGKPVNVKDLTTFQPNNHWVITYPTSGDRTLDSQNADTFVKFELIRIPIELGGDKQDPSSFVAFSKVCVHLWCSPNYIPTQKENPKEFGYTTAPDQHTHKHYECPCHGSTYDVPSGLAIGGPASLQPPPTNAIPILTLTADSNGFLYVEPPVWDPHHNGVQGLGRFVPGKTS
jgi:Rieske Fe-S protein